MGNEKNEQSIPSEENLISSNKTSGSSFPVAGIGISSDSIELAIKFACSMPGDTGAAFVAVSAHDTDTESLIRELRNAELQMPVIELNEKQEVRPDQFYVVSSTHLLTISEGILHPARIPGDLKMPIDHFLRSLADERRDASIAVILCGEGTDGTFGIRNIHESGGISIVQDPDETGSNEMLRSAVSTGCVDYVLPAGEIPAQLSSYIHALTARLKHGAGEVEENVDYLPKILQLLRSKMGNDFSTYKKSTIYRRIEKRMNLHDLQNYGQYYVYLQDHPEEVRLLFKELLISVTNFFRDPESFEALKNNIFPKILNNKSESYTVRAWVPACATGEEVYSIAMLLQEYKDEHNLNFRMQIFGTDINEESIQKARMGIYPGNIEMDVNPDRLSKFFIRTNDTYIIKKDIRESAIFAVQNITKDAPFTKLDILCCRNLLIYFGSELQERLLPVFHYSLKPDGILMLGSSESVGKFTDDFRPLDKKWKIFQKIETFNSNAVFNSNLSFRVQDAPLHLGAVEGKRTRETGLADLVQKTLITNFTPPSVLINERGDILYVHGHTSKYLEIASGQANLNILNMAKDGLQYELHSAIHEAILNRNEAVRTGLKMKNSSEGQLVKITVKPVDGNPSAMSVLLVVFEDVEIPKVIEDVVKKKGQRKYTGKAEELRQELQFTKENLQATIEELQASNEELQSANEELQSTNEELQSTNEEMETSKEELQSVNEELITLNAELQSKIEQLSHAEDDMRNLLNSTNIGTIFLDSKMRIKRFTSEAVKIVNLIGTDIGRPIEHIVTNLKYDGLIKDIQDVIHSLSYIEREVQTKDDNWYLLRVMPYRTVENVIDGVVLTFTGITSLKSASEKLDKLSFAVKAEREYAESLIHIVRQPVIVLDSDMNIIAVNDSFCTRFGLNREQLLNRNISEFESIRLNSAGFTDLMENLDGSGQVRDFPMSIDIPDKTQKKFLVNAKKIQRGETGLHMVLISLEET